VKQGGLQRGSTSLNCFEVTRSLSRGCHRYGSVSPHPKRPSKDTRRLALVSMKPGNAQGSNSDAMNLRLGYFPYGKGGCSACMHLQEGRHIQTGEKFRITVFRDQILQRHLARLCFVVRQSVGPNHCDRMLGRIRGRSQCIVKSTRGASVDDPFASIWQTRRPCSVVKRPVSTCVRGRTTCKLASKSKFSRAIASSTKLRP